MALATLQSGRMSIVSHPMVTGCNREAWCALYTSPYMVLVITNIRALVHCGFRPAQVGGVHSTGMLSSAKIILDQLYQWETNFNKDVPMKNI